ncbi:hypothetical protein COTS27_00830 [Spirochaetota bacterium]|nr:hypothetical protein COTS27_00830 [Spirochaetota bacterium]
MGFLTDLGHFKREDIVFSSQATTRDEMIRDLVARLRDAHRLNFDMEDIVGKFLLRERKGSTAVANGVAIPHIRTSEVSSFFLAIGLHHKGIDFHAIDDAMTHIVILVIFPEGQSQHVLKFLANLSRFLLKDHSRKRILKARDEDELLEYLRKSI